MIQTGGKHIEITSKYCGNGCKKKLIIHILNFGIDVPELVTRNAVVKTQQIVPLNRNNVAVVVIPTP